VELTRAAGQQVDPVQAAELQAKGDQHRHDQQPQAVGRRHQIGAAVLAFGQQRHL
jgi:hypothetical protein